MADEKALAIGTEMDTELATSAEELAEIQASNRQPTQVVRPEADKTDPPKAAKNKGGRPAGSSWIARLMGSSEKAIVYKRHDNGQLALCGEYTQRDIERSTNMEIFIQDFLVPKFDFGKYIVRAVMTDGSERQFPEVTIERPKGVAGAGGSDPMAVFTAMSEAQIKLTKEAERKAEETAGAVGGQLENLLKLSNLLNPTAGKAAAEPMNPMMMMMMLQMLQPKPSQHENVGSSAISAMHEAFKAALEQARVASIPPPMPFMPPADPGPDIAAMVTALSTALRPSGPSTLDVITSVAPLVAPLLKKENAFKITELIGILPIIQDLIEKMSGSAAISELRQELREMRQEKRSSGGIADTLNEFRMLREVAQEMNPPTRASEGFFEFMRDFVQALPDTANAIGDLVGKINASKPGGRALPAKNSDDEDDIVLRYPPGFAEYAAKIGESKDDGALVGNTLKAFQFLGRHDGWSKHLGGMLAQAKGGNKEEVLDFIKSFLEGMRDGGNLDAEVTARAVGAFERNIDSVIAWAQGFGKRKAALPADKPAAQG